MATIACVFTLMIKSIKAEKLGSLLNLKTLVANFCLIFSGWPYFSMSGINNPTWYLCILVQCYLLFYIIYWIGEMIKIDKIWLYVAVIPVAFGLRHFLLLADSTYRGFEAFFIGVTLYKLGIKFQQKKCIAVIVAAGSILLLIVSSAAMQRRIMTFVVAPIVVILSVSWNERVNIKAEKIIRILGQVSFEVFIWHYPLMAVEQMVRRVFGFEFYRSYLSMFGFALIVWLIAYIVFWYVEMPINRMIGKYTV